MTDQLHVTLAAQYSSEEEAVEDFENIQAFHDGAGKDSSFDAALVTRDTSGKVAISQRVRGGKHHGGRNGLAVGAAGGLVLALFPAVALGSALLVAGGTGAGIGAIAGRIAKKSSTEDLKMLSETLQAGSAGIVLVTDGSEVDEMQELLTSATSVTRRELEFDEDALDEDTADSMR